MQILSLLDEDTGIFADCVAFSADGKRIMMASDYGVVVIADATTGAEVSRRLHPLLTSKVNFPKR